MNPLIEKLKIGTALTEAVRLQKQVESNVDISPEDARILQVKCWVMGNTINAANYKLHKYELELKQLRDNLLNDIGSEEACPEKSAIGRERYAKASPKWRKAQKLAKAAEALRIFTDKQSKCFEVGVYMMRSIAENKQRDMRNMSNQEEV